MTEEITTIYETVVSDSVIEKLDIIIEGEQAIFNALWIIIGILVVLIVIKFVWTFLAKWLFGGI